MFATISFLFVSSFADTGKGLYNNRYLGISIIAHNWEKPEIKWKSLIKVFKHLE